jgi:hypothetical protein
LDLSYRTLKKLNPQFKSSYIPKNDGRYSLVLPQSKYEDYLKIYDIESYNKLIESRRQNRIKRLAEIQKMMEKDRVEPLKEIEQIAPKQVYTEMSMQKSVAINT